MTHPAQLTRVQWNTKSLGGGLGGSLGVSFFFSKASVKAIKMPNFLLVFIEGI